jgi:hypothetical protein
LENKIHVIERHRFCGGGANVVFAKSLRKQNDNTCKNFFYREVLTEARS